MHFDILIIHTQGSIRSELPGASLADALGKQKTILQMVTAIDYLLYLASNEGGLFGFLRPLYEVHLLSPPVLGNVLLAITVLITIVSGLAYLLHNKELLRED